MGFFGLNREEWDLTEASLLIKGSLLLGELSIGFRRTASGLFDISGNLCIEFLNSFD